MNKEELKKIVENCCDAISNNKHYTSGDAYLEIAQCIDEYTDGMVNLIRHKVLLQRAFLKGYDLGSAGNKDFDKEFKTWSKQNL
jgi:hypothetical protein